MKSIQTILCPVDFTAVSGRELQLAGQLASRFAAALVIHHNVPSAAALGVDWMYQKEHHAEDRARQEAIQQQLAEMMASLPEKVRSHTRAVVTYGALDYSVHGAAREVGADLIVIGTHGRQEPTHSGETERLIRQAPCPVLTTHDDAPDTWLPDLDAPDGPHATGATDAASQLPTVVPVDFSSHSVRALRYALDLRARLPLAVTVFHALDSPKRDAKWAEAQLGQVISSEERTGVAFDVRHGRPADQILFEEDFLGARLLIMGSHARGFVERILSLGTSTASDVLQLSPCPVWYVPASAAA